MNKKKKVKQCIQVYLILSLGSTSINSKKLKYQYSTTETMLLRQILFYSVAISHHIEISTDDINNHFKSLITLPEWDKQTINMRNSKYER